MSESETRRPLVSAIVPTYGRRPDLLVEAIASIDRQTYDEIEVIVVDDSPGVSKGLASRRWEGIRRLRSLTDGEHDGPSDARNAGLCVAEGEYVAFLDDDDRWLPTKTARQLKAFETETEGRRNVGLVCVGQRYENGDGRVTGLHRPTIQGDVTRDLLHGEALAPTSSAMIRADLVREHGLWFDDRLPCWEDRDWYLRASRHCRIESIPDPLVVRGLGEHEHVSDDFEAIRDVAHPRFVAKHRPLAATYGDDCERQFVRSSLVRLGRTALTHGRYGDARRYSIQALRYGRPVTQPMLTFALALGGRSTHRLGRVARGTYDRL